MTGKTGKNPQLSVFCIPLVNGITMKHELVELAQRINLKSIEKDFALYYSDMERQAIPVRKMVGCMLLKQMYGQSDESFVDRWIENPYWQYFWGEIYFQFEKPFDPREFVHFRKRLGADEAEKLLKFSISLFEKK